MSQSNVKVSTEALSGLNDKLMNLAGCLHSIYEFMVNNMKKIGEDAWQDHKYQEFVDGYSPQILKCDNIAERYEKWCKDAITPLLGKVEKVDSASVTLDGVGSSSGVGGAAAGAGAAGAAAASGAKSNKAAEFNTGTRKVVARSNNKSSKSESKKEVEKQLTKDKKDKKKKSDYLEAIPNLNDVCEQLHGSNYHAVEAGPNDQNVHTIGTNYNKESGGFHIDFGIGGGAKVEELGHAEAKLDTGYKTGKKTTGLDGKFIFKCEENKEND